MRIGFFELEGWEEGAIRKGLSGHDLFVSRKRIDDANLPERKDFNVISVFIDSRVTPKVIEALPELKLVTTRSTGYEHLDLAALAKRGVAAAYVPGYGDNTVAEFAFGLLLNLTRKMYQGIDQIKETGSFSSEGLRGVDIKGKTIGIVGTGRIGREMIRIAAGFGMRVVAADPHPDGKFAKEAGFEYVPLEKLLARSDIISIHCPFTKETRHLINAGNVGLIKKGAYLVNTARGGIVETAALIQGLQSGILRGAALDVLEEEKEVKEELEFLSKDIGEEELRIMLQNLALMKMPNVLITPHNAFNSEEAMQRILQTTIENIGSFAAGKPVNLVRQ